jgi:carboxymethylenebutenolidase
MAVPRNVRIPISAGELAGFLAAPSGPPPWPGLVVVHEAYGLTVDIVAHVDRLAAAGYLTVAPDLFGRGPKLRCLRQTFQALKAGHGDAFDDIEASRAWLAGRADCTGRIGVLGFCMGGDFALLAAPRYDFAAAAVNYGRVPDDADQILRGACPIVGSYGGRDRFLRDHGPRLQAALTTAEIPHDVKVYPDAGHSFLNRHPTPLRILGKVTGTTYHGPSADDAWQRILAFFATHLHPVPGAPTHPQPATG